MPAASRSQLEELHALLVRDALQYLRETPPAQRRATRMMSIRRLLADSNVGGLRAYSRRFSKTLKDLYQAYAEGLVAQVMAGDMRPGVIAEVRLFLKAHGINAESIDDDREGPPGTTARPTLDSLKLVLPFAIDGTRRGDH